MKTILAIVLACLFAVFVIYHFRTVDDYESQIKNNNVEIAHLKKQSTDVQYDFGYSLVRTHCLACHRFKSATDNLLEGVVQRVGEKYLTLFLTRQDSLIKVNDVYATQLKAKFGNLGNSHNFEFSPTELKAIIEFMKE